MEKVLIVSANPKAAEALSDLMSRFYSAYSFCVAQSSSFAKEQLKNADYDLLLINANGNSEELIDFALLTAAKTSTPVILILPQGYDKTSLSKLCENGVPVLQKPVESRLFEHLLVMARATRKRLLGFSHKIEEIKLINRAKFALMQYLSLSEEQAHKYIERQAMDMRTSKSEIAEGILKAYEV